MASIIKAVQKFSGHMKGIAGKFFAENIIGSVVGRIHMINRIQGM